MAARDVLCITSRLRRSKRFVTSFLLQTWVETHARPINFDDVSQHSDDDDNDGLHFDDSRNRPRSSQANRRAIAGRRNAVVTVNDGNNDDDDDKNGNNDDDDEAIWESLDPDASAKAAHALFLVPL